MNAAAETVIGEIVVNEATVLAQFSEFETQLAEFKSRYEGRVYDLDDPKQDKQARSDRRAIGVVIANLDRRHKIVKEPLLDATRVVDGARKRIKDELLEVQEGIKEQIEAHEQRERDRIKALEDRLAGIRMLVMASEPTAALWGERLRYARAIVIDDTWQEFEAEAAKAKDVAVAALEKLRAEALVRETEAAELAQLRAEREAMEQRERDARIAAEAAERARREAEDAVARERERMEREARLAQEKAAREAREAKEQAEREIAEANARAERAVAAERARIEREQRAETDRAEAERRAETARQASLAHRNRIHERITAALVEHAGLDDDEAVAVLEAVVAGVVPHVQVDYS